MSCAVKGAPRHCGGFFWGGYCPTQRKDTFPLPLHPVSIPPYSPSYPKGKPVPGSEEETKYLFASPEITSRIPSSSRTTKSLSLFGKPVLPFWLRGYPDGNRQATDESSPRWFEYSGEVHSFAFTAASCECLPRSSLT